MHLVEVHMLKVYSLYLLVLILMLKENEQHHQEPILTQKEVGQLRPGLDHTQKVYLLLHLVNLHMPVGLIVSQ